VVVCRIDDLPTFHVAHSSSLPPDDIAVAKDKVHVLPEATAPGKTDPKMIESLCAG
jgi:hypothetical protein